MKIRKDKERNSRISLALLLHSTVGLYLPENHQQELRLSKQSDYISQNHGEAIWIEKLLSVFTHYWPSWIHTRKRLGAFTN